MFEQGAQHNRGEIQQQEEVQRQTNAMQVALMKRYAERMSEELNDTHMLGWIERYSRAFREYIESYPETLEKWKEDPEMVLLDIESFLERGIQEAA